MDKVLNIKKYTLVSSSCPDDLSNKVNELLGHNDGWVLYGNPIMSADERYDNYAQALVIYV